MELESEYIVTCCKIALFYYKNIVNNIFCANYLYLQFMSNIYR